MRFLRVLAFFISSVLLVTVGNTAQHREKPRRIHIVVQDRAAVVEIGRMLSLDEASRGNNLYAWARDKDIQRLEEMGYQWDEAPEAPRFPEAYTTCTGPDPFVPPASWNCYPSYQQYVDLMNYYADTYPTLCKLVDLGPSGTGNHRLLALKISDNVNNEEDEPEFFYTATMHGDETTGYVLSLRLAHELLTLYSSDTEISGLVNSMVIWINPLANPDGTFMGGDNTVSGSQRSLANGDDPNRSFPNPDDGDDPNTGTWNIEIQDMMDLAGAESFVMSANFHGGAEVVNYPWDVWSTLHPDDTWFHAASLVYASNAQADSPNGYMTGVSSDGTTNGYAWYYAAGTRQDYMNYYQGCREVTIELSSSKTLDSNQLEAYWGYNRQAMLDFMKEAQKGIQGIVTDAVSSDPVAATVKVVGHDSETYKTFAYTDPDVGDYHRPISSGTWSLEFSAWGYVTQTISNIGVTKAVAAVRQDVSMVRESDTVKVSGTITDANTGLPVSGAVVHLSGSPLPAIHTDSSGDYSFPSVLAGSYSLSVSAERYIDGNSSNFSVTAGGSDVDVDLTLVPILYVTVSGVVRDSETGSAISGVTVAFSGPSTGSGATNASGSYQVADLKGGSYQVTATASGYGTARQNIELNQANQQLDFQLNPTTALVSEDFETDNGSFTVSGGGWAWGTDSTAGAASGTKVWGTVLNSDYSYSVSWNLDSPTISIPADVETAELVYQQWYEIESGWDGGQLQISVDGGAFSLLTPSTPYPDDTVDALGDTPGFTGTANSWAEIRTDLQNYIGHSVVIRWWFASDSSNEERGWYLDDVEVLTSTSSSGVFSDGFESGGTDQWSFVSN